MSETITEIADVRKWMSNGWTPRNCIFRGQSADLPLLPRIARSNEGPSLLGLEDDIITRLKSHYLRMHSADGDHSDFRVRPVDMYEWDWLVLAQHHGLPTKLLDWSAKPEVAIYFAVQSSEDDDRDGVLHVFEDPMAIARRAGLDRIQNVRRYRAYRHPHFRFLRVQRQKGELTFQPDATKELSTQLGREPRQKYRKFVVPREKKQYLRSELAKIGITHGYLFPGLDGVCREIAIELGFSI